jgi:hypothetical protein
MSELAKKLYYRKSGSTVAIKRYSDVADMSGKPYLCTKDGSAVGYSSLAASGSNLSDLKVRRGGTVYNVETQGIPEGVYLLSADHPEEEIFWDATLGNYLYVRSNSLGDDSDNVDLFVDSYGAGSAYFSYAIYGINPFIYEDISYAWAGGKGEVYRIDNNTVRLKFLLNTGDALVAVVDYPIATVYISQTLSLLPVV